MPEKYLCTSPDPEKYLYTPEKYLYAPPEKYLYTSPEPEKPEKYLYTPVFIHTFQAPGKCLYTLMWRRRGRRSRRSIYIHRFKTAIDPDSGGSVMINMA